MKLLVQQVQWWLIIAVQMARASFRETLQFNLNCCLELLLLLLLLLSLICSL